MTGLGSAVGVMYSLRRYRDSLVMELNKPVHQDNSECRIATARPQVVPTVKIVTTETSSALLEEEKYSRFVQGIAVKC